MRIYKRLLIICLLFLLLDLSYVISPSFAQPETNHLQVSVMSAEMRQTIKAWFEAQKAKEDGDIAIALKIYLDNNKKIQKMPEKQYQECFFDFNQVLLESTYKNETPNFSQLDDGCFDNVIGFLARYSINYLVPDASEQENE